MTFVCMRVIRKIYRFGIQHMPCPWSDGQEMKETLRENALVFYVSAYIFLFKFSRQPTLLLRTWMQ